MHALINDANKLFNVRGLPKATAITVKHPREQI